MFSNKATFVASQIPSDLKKKFKNFIKMIYLIELSKRKTMQIHPSIYIRPVLYLTLEHAKCQFGDPNRALF